MTYQDLLTLDIRRLRTQEEIDLLQTIVLDLGDAPDFRSALHAVLRRVCEKTGWILGLAWLPDAEKTELHHGATWPRKDHDDRLDDFRRASEQITLPLGVGLPGRVWSTRTAAWILDATTDKNFPRSDAARRSDLKTGLAIPILLKEEVVAVIEFYVHERRDEDESLIRLITVVAAQLGLMIQRLRAEDALRTSEIRYRTLLRNAPVCIHEISEQRTLTAINRAGLKMLGIEDESQVQDVPVLDLVSPADRQRVQGLLDRAFAGEFCEFEFATMNSPEPQTFLSCFMPVRDDDGVVRRLVGISQDITDHKRAQEQLRQAQKMEAVGRLAGGVAHDFNTILAVIRGYSEMLLDNPGVSGSAHKQIEQIHKAAARAVSLTRQLLGFSQKHIVRPTVANLNGIVNDTSEMLRRLIGANIELRLLLDPQPRHVMVNQGSIDQVLLNLVINARDAMPSGGMITVQTSHVELKKELAVSDRLLGPGRYVVLTVTDTGTGLDSNTRAHMFEPFFTTKENGKGTGLGLATVYGIAKQCRGGIRVHSVLGEGTSFEIYFPQVEAPAEIQPDTLASAAPGASHVATQKGPASSQSFPVAARQETVPGIADTVVVVEDNTPLRQMTCKFLESFGCPVLDFESGADAIQKIKEFEGPISLLITDVVMPGMSGPELAERLQAVRPELKVLFVSGYTNDEMTCTRLSASDRAFVQKPFTRNDLAESIHSLLGRLA